MNDNIREFERDFIFVSMVVVGLCINYYFIFGHIGGAICAMLAASGLLGSSFLFFCFSIPGRYREWQDKRAKRLADRVMAAHVANRRLYR